MVKGGPNNTGYFQTNTGREETGISEVEPLTAEGTAQKGDGRFPRW